METIGKHKPLSTHRIRLVSGSGSDLLLTSRGRFESQKSTKRVRVFGDLWAAGG